MGNKKVIKLNENQLRQIVKESVRNILKESEGICLENCLILFKKAADNVWSCIDRYFDDDIFGDSNDEYYASMKRLAKEVSEECEKMLSTVYNQGPKEISEQKMFNYGLNEIGSVAFQLNFDNDYMNKQIGNFNKKYSYYNPDDVVSDIERYFKGGNMRNNPLYEITMKDLRWMINEAIDRIKNG